MVVVVVVVVGCVEEGGGGLDEEEEEEEEDDAGGTTGSPHLTCAVLAYLPFILDFPKKDRLSGFGASFSVTETSIVDLQDDTREQWCLSLREGTHEPRHWLPLVDYCVLFDML